MYSIICKLCKKEFPWNTLRKKYCEGCVKAKWKEYHKKYRQREEVKAKKKEYMKAYMKAYSQQPEYKARLKVYHKEYYKEYHQQPENKARAKELRQQPEYKARLKVYHKEYYQREEVKARVKEYHQQPEQKAKAKEYRQREEVKLRNNRHCAKYGKTKKGKLSGKKREAKRRHHLRNCPQIYTLKEWDDKVNNTQGICPMCKKDVGIEKLHLDHILPISKAPSGFVYTIDDVQPLCPSCNPSKGSRLMKEYYKEYYQREDVKVKLKIY
jgi:5-methylcytosine-specific restriction endonuclease McrA